MFKNLTIKTRLIAVLAFLVFELIVGFAIGVPAFLLQMISTSVTLYGGAVMFLLAAFQAWHLPKSKQKKSADAALEYDELHSGTVLRAAHTMRFLRGAVGFMFFHLAFWLRSEIAGTAWFAFAVALGNFSILAANWVAPWVREHMKTATMLTVSLAAVAVGGVAARIEYAGEAPHAVAGLLQVNFRVPATAPIGDAVPVVLMIGGIRSSEQATMAVRPAQQQVLLVEPDAAIRRRLERALKQAGFNVLGEDAANQPVDLVVAAMPSAADMVASLRHWATRGGVVYLMLLAGGVPDPRAGGETVRTLAGGLLVQSRDNGRLTDDMLKVVTKRQPTEAELRDLKFAFRVAKHVKSNAIVLAKDGMTVGVGAGQMSRVDSARLAGMKAKEMAEAAGEKESRAIGSVVGSDAFFPFADGLIACAEAGATAVIQPGGSVRDDEVIRAADEAGLAMVFTGVRHFRH